MLDNSYDIGANQNPRDEGIVGGSIYDPTVSYAINTVVQLMLRVNLSRI